MSAPLQPQLIDARFMKRQHVLTATYARFKHWCDQHEISTVRAQFVRTAHDLRGVTWDQVVIEEGWTEGRRPDEVMAIMHELDLLQALA